MSATPQADLYPSLEPFQTGFLDVSGGHRLAYEVCGNPRGYPVIFLHGGPGAGCSPGHRRFFDPAVYRIVLFDQRGAGRSTPYASVENNTTADLVSDIEALRKLLEIERWLVFGGSWGSTLALAYAATHPGSCSAMVLRGIWLCRPSDVQWWFDGIRIVYPEYWREFSTYIPPAERSDLLAAYWRRLIDPDPGIHMAAAAVWDRYETLCSTLLPGSTSASPSRLALARLEAHYMRHKVFLRENELIDAVPRFRDVPCSIIHGRYDMLCPVDGAVELANAWTGASLTIVPDAGHSAFEPGIRRELVMATDRFRYLYHE
ncbi:MAG TPA: prolyl aminopeptidase [Steroidobacteraceae bacterium]|jgi:proline iminopeptidase